MLANRTDLTNYVLKRDGYYGKKGTVRYSTRDEELFRLKEGEQLKPNGKN